MQSIEDYWNSCERYGLTRELSPGKMTFRVPPGMGDGGFEVWGDTKIVMAYVCDLTLNTPWIGLEHTEEKYLKLSQFYSGKVSFYKRRNEIDPVNYGLNCLVNYPPLSRYRRIHPETRLICAGLLYREDFFARLPFALPGDFWEAAAGTLKPGLITMPKISLLCEQLRSCPLTGTNLEMFVAGKALEALAYILDYIYSGGQKQAVNLSAQDHYVLEQVKDILHSNLMNPPDIQALSVCLGMNRRKLMEGFKQLNGMTIHTYLKQLRMEKAAGLLRDDSLSISEIARLVGYYGDGHFQKAFKDIFGVTPSKIRKELQPFSKSTCNSTKNIR